MAVSCDHDSRHPSYSRVNAYRILKGYLHPKYLLDIDVEKTAKAVKVPTEIKDLMEENLVEGGSLERQKPTAMKSDKAVVAMKKIVGIKAKKAGKSGGVVGGGGNAAASSAAALSGANPPDPSAPPVPRKRGRPRKQDPLPDPRVISNDEVAKKPAGNTKTVAKDKDPRVADAKSGVLQAAASKKAEQAPTSPAKGENSGTAETNLPVTSTSSATTPAHVSAPAMQMNLSIVQHVSPLLLNISPLLLPQRTTPACLSSTIVEGKHAGVVFGAVSPSRRGGSVLVLPCVHLVVEALLAAVDVLALANPRTKMEESVFHLGARVC